MFKVARDRVVDARLRIVSDPPLADLLAGEHVSHASGLVWIRRFGSDMHPSRDIAHPPWSFLELTSARREFPRASARHARILHRTTIAGEELPTKVACGRGQ